MGQSPNAVGARRRTSYKSITTPRLQQPYKKRIVRRPAANVEAAQPLRPFCGCRRQAAGAERSEAIPPPPRGGACEAGGGGTATRVLSAKGNSLACPTLRSGAFGISSADTSATHAPSDMHPQRFNSPTNPNLHFPQNHRADNTACPSAVIF